MRLSGTSFAAPVVAGAAAQILAGIPNWTPDQVKGALMSGAAAPADEVPPAPPASARSTPGRRRAVRTRRTRTGLNRFSAGPGDRDDRVRRGQLDGAAKASVSWDSVSWADVSWTDVSWADVSWSDVSWADVSWATFSQSADVSWEDTAGGEVGSRGGD